MKVNQESDTEIFLDEMMGCLGLLLIGSAGVETYRPMFLRANGEPQERT